MQIQLVLMGKTRFPFIMAGMSEYMKRLRHYTDFSVHELPDLKNTASWPQSKFMKEEGIRILNALTDKDFVVLLDERGTEMDSIEMAEWLDKIHQDAIKKLVFVVGGAFGFSPDVYKRGNKRLSLSKLTFSHQVIPLFFTEQLYRAFTIIRGAPYHHG